ncbi:MAG: hypothetical protein MUD17_10575 [Gemmatimonadaceae bacterium]|nr:hypothetical protein [Gemmatimonadaceae bacterium]
MASDVADALPESALTLSDVGPYLRAQTEPLLSRAQVLTCVGLLETTRLALSRETDVEHAEGLQRRFGGARRPEAVGRHPERSPSLE